jgi:hypothetical protein
MESQRLSLQQHKTAQNMRASRGEVRKVESKCSCANGRIVFHALLRREKSELAIVIRSISQVVFALTQVVNRPVHGRIFFEEVLRKNLDLGRPDNMQLIFARRVTKRTLSPFRTRVVREGVRTRA